MAAPPRAPPAAAPPPASAAPTVKVAGGAAVWRRRRRTPLLLVALVLVLAALAVLELRGGELGGGQAARAPDQPTAAATSRVTVTLQATAAVWARATVDGQVAYEGTMTAGSRRTFTGRRLVELHLGNAGGVQLTVNGAPRGAPGRPGHVWRGRFGPTARGP
jgi:hypothetical protein